MKITPKSSLVEVAFSVCTALDSAGIKAVLTGGSAATFYAPAAYQSFDLDFVIAFRSEKSDGPKRLLSLGFEQIGDYYKHPDCKFPLEFPPGPLMVGDDLVTTWSTEHEGERLLYVLEPTDSCRDRLAAYLFWNDFAGLEQALAVYSSQTDDIDLEKIESWCKRERQQEKYELFLERIKTNP